MPREYAKNWFSMWADEDFCNQPVFDKLFYNMLCGQRGVNNAGVLAINYTRWRKALRDGDRIPAERDLKTALRRMEGRRYVFVDEDAGEILIRAHVRRDELEKQPNILLSALRLMAVFDSAKFARVMLSELERIVIPTINSEKPSGVKLQSDLRAADAAARTHLGTLAEGLSEPFPEPFSEDFPEPPSNRTPREGFSEDFREPPVVVVVEACNSPSTEKSLKAPPYPPEFEPTADRVPAIRTTGAEKARSRFLAIPTNGSPLSRQIAQAYSDSLDVPIEAKLLNDVGTEIDRCLRSAIPPDAIAAGIELWARSDSWAPSQIPKFVHKASTSGRAPANGLGKPSQTALSYQDAGEALLAKVSTK